VIVGEYKSIKIVFKDGVAYQNGRYFFQITFVYFRTFFTLYKMRKNISISKKKDFSRWRPC
jgi:hypothetical protein